MYTVTEVGSRPFRSEKMFLGNLVGKNVYGTNLSMRPQNMRSTTGDTPSFNFGFCEEGKRDGSNEGFPPLDRLSSLSSVIWRVVLR